MNRPDDELQLYAAFAGRLAAAPHPSDAMRARTFAAIAPPPIAVHERSRVWGRAFSALGAVGRFGAATAIVVCAGTLALGSVRIAPGRDDMPVNAPPLGVSFEQTLPTMATVSRSGSIALTVADVGHTARTIAAIVKHRDGVIVRSGRAARTTHRGDGALALVLRVPTHDLDSTLRAIDELGSARTRIAARDLSAAVAANARQLLRARDRERRLEATGMPRLQAAAESGALRLSAQETALDSRVANAIVAVVLIPTADGMFRREPAVGQTRRTSISLARRSRIETHRSELADAGLPAVDRAPSADRAGDSRADGTPA